MSGGLHTKIVKQKDKVNTLKRNDLRLRLIPDFPDYYVEEELGNIWSFKRYVDGRILKPKVRSRSEKTKSPKTVAVNLYKNGKLYTKIVSRLVMNVTDPKIEVDHKDRNIWHNERSNLRIANSQQQKYNTTSYSKTGFKGVRIRGSGFQTQIWLDNKSKCLGTYSNIFEAAAIWNIEASKHHGKFAVYNKVDGYILTI